MQSVRTKTKASGRKERITGIREGRSEGELAVKSSKQAATIVIIAAANYEMTKPQTTRITTQERTTYTYNARRTYPGKRKGERAL